MTDGARLGCTVIGEDIIGEAPLDIGDGCMVVNVTSSTALGTKLAFRPSFCEVIIPGEVETAIFCDIIKVPLCVMNPRGEFPMTAAGTSVSMLSSLWSGD